MSICKKIKRNKLMSALLAIALMLAVTACNSSIPPEVSGDEDEVSVSVEAEKELEDVESGQLSSDVQEEYTPESDSSGENEEQEEISAPELDIVEESASIASQSAASTTPADNGAESNTSDEPSTNERSDGMIAVNITIGNETFAALFHDNEASRSLVGQMPLTITMSDLNRNEKFYNFPDNLHSSSTESPSTIRAGEIMCWSGNCLVLFYETFSNSYGGYVKMGYIEDTSGLAAAVGTGSVTVTFSAA